MTLEDLGWDAGWAEAFTPHAAAGFTPARVVCELRRKFYGVQSADGERLGECVGRLFHRATTAADFPAVGDWVAIKPLTDPTRASIHAVLPRRTCFSRRAVGDRDAVQIVAANLDTVFIVGGLDRNFHPRRIERYIAAAHDSGATPVVLLNKTDLHDDPAAVRATVLALAPDVPVILTSAETRRGLKAVLTHAAPGRTVAFLGSSGVGKSSLINALLRDDAMPTAEVRDKDSKGRHTTTRRELVVAPNGALVIDTPGMRELQLWDAGTGLAETFADVAALTRECRFSDCRHQGEPGCAVAAALAAGTLDPARWGNFRKLLLEQSAPSRRTAAAGVAAGLARWKKARRVAGERTHLREHLD